MLLLDLATERRLEGWSRLPTLPRELKWSKVRCRFVCSQELDRSWEEELAWCRPDQEGQPLAEGNGEAASSGWLSENLVACQE